MSATRRVVDMWSSSLFFRLMILAFMILGDHVFITTAQWKEQSLGELGPFLKKNQRSTILSTEYGDISEARLTDGNEAFQIHFITLEPNSLFLPVFLHYDMVFYVQTGSGRLSFLDEDEKEHRKLRRGDVHRLRCGSVFFIQSDLDNERQKLRLIAIFDNPEYDFNEPASGPYSSVSDLVLGFDETVLRAIFKAPEPLIEEIRHGTRPVAIIHGLQQQKTEYEFMEDMYNILDWSNKKKKSKLFNVYDKDPDFKNDNGWSTVVDKKKYGPLKGSKYGVFMVYLTEGSMMGPHWNPVATEVGVAVKGRGMIHVVCPRMKDVSKCNNSRFLVELGDVFVVPRFHAMAQMAFDNETFVFVGFSTSTEKNHPQYLAGKASVPRTLDKHIMAASLGINVSIFEQLWDEQAKSIILDCNSCAEEEWMRMMEDIAKERQREEEEARKREEEKRREEETARKKEEEESERKREEEEAEAEAAAQKQREVEEAWKRWAEEVRKWQEQQRREQKEKEREEQQQKQEEEEREKQEQQEQEEEEREKQEQQQKQEEEEREKQKQEEIERQEQQRRWEKEESKRREQQQEEDEREGQEQAQEAEREREAQAEREEEAAKEQEEEAAKEQEEEAAKGQGQWGEGPEEQEEWTDKEREQGGSSNTRTGRTSFTGEKRGSSRTKVVGRNPWARRILNNI